MEPPLPILPDDIIEDIFTRLPASSALRCRGLSRAWAATLSSDAFVDRHLRNANRHGVPRFFFLRLTSTFTTVASSAYAWSPARPGNGFGAVPLPPLTPPPPLRTMRDGITQQCRGLVLLEEHDCQGAHYVYNPSTDHTAALPPRTLTAGRRLPAHGCYESFGLGYDVRIRKHKVVRVYYRGDTLPVLCEVYVVGGDSGAGFWSAAAPIGRPEATKPSGWVSSYEPSVFAQGHVHWMAQKDKPKHDSYWRVTREGLIVSFSVADEAFGVVPLPPGVDYLGEYRMTELEGRLCLFSPSVVDHINGGCRPYDVWSLSDHEAGVWDLRCRIDLHTASPEVRRFIDWCVSPVAAMDDGRHILFMPTYAYDRLPGAEARPCVYTPATGVIKRLPYARGLMASYDRNGDRNWAVTLYEESLVSPGRPHLSPAAT